MAVLHVRRRLKEVDVFGVDETTLEYDCSNNAIEDLSLVIGRATNLRSLVFAENRVSEISPLIGSLANLQTLIGDVNVIPDLPADLLRLRKLRRLSLSYNKLSKIPSEGDWREGWKNLSSLVFLNLAHNALEGTIPALLSECLGSLAHLDLSSNNLTSFEDGLWRLHSLTFLNVSSNRLTRLPEGLSASSSLRTLLAAKNELTSVPSDFGRLGELEELDLKGNCIEVLPESIANLVSLTCLSVSSNRLQELPHQLSNCVALRLVYASHNALKFIPVTFGRMTSLKEIHVKDNQLTTIPEELMTCVIRGDLRLVDASDNPLNEKWQKRIKDHGSVVNYFVTTHELEAALLAREAQRTQAALEFKRSREVEHMHEEVVHELEESRAIIRAHGGGQGAHHHDEQDSTHQHRRH